MSDSAIANVAGLTPEQICDIIKELQATSSQNHMTFIFANNVSLGGGVKMTQIDAQNSQQPTISTGSGRTQGGEGNDGDLGDGNNRGVHITNTTTEHSNTLTQHDDGFIKQLLEGAQAASEDLATEAQIDAADTAFSKLRKVRRKFGTNADPEDLAKAMLKATDNDTLLVTQELAKQLAKFTNETEPNRILERLKQGVQGITVSSAFITWVSFILQLIG